VECLRSNQGSEAAAPRARSVDHGRQCIGLLHELDLSITAVSASVGYDDVTTFERVFKRLEGVCPREHRRRISRRAAQPTPNAETGTPNAETHHAVRN
jgi:hypothetical protein